MLLWKRQYYEGHMTVLMQLLPQVQIALSQILVGGLLTAMTSPLKLPPHPQWSSEVSVQSEDFMYIVTVVL